MTIIGLCGSLLDSVLGATLQASVVDVRSGKIVEGEGGRKVLVHDGSAAHKSDRKGESRRIEVGYDILSNNGVNLLMAASMSLFAMAGAAWIWDISLMDVFSVS